MATTPNPEPLDGGDWFNGKQPVEARKVEEKKAEEPKKAQPKPVDE